MIMTSVAGTNLKVRGTGPVQSAGKNGIFGGALQFVGSKSAISRFGERFCDGQYGLVSFLFAVLLLTVPPPFAAICKSWGGTCPQCPMESAPLIMIIIIIIIHEFTLSVISKQFSCSGSSRQHNQLITYPKLL